MPAFLTRWSRAHPEIGPIMRDRPGAYQEAATQGEPQVRQTADRWHLLKAVVPARESFNLWRFVRVWQGVLGIGAKAGSLPPWPAPGMRRAAIDSREHWSDVHLPE